MATCVSALPPARVLNQRLTVCINGQLERAKNLGITFGTRFQGMVRGLLKVHRTGSDGEMIQPSRNNLGAETRTQTRPTFLLALSSSGGEHGGCPSTALRPSGQLLLSTSNVLTCRSRGASWPKVSRCYLFA